jgi:hypothetical protein
MYLTKQQHWELTHTMTDYLAEREQLMHDIECIVDAFFYEKYNGDVAEGDELTRILCDAVCKNFPTN